MSYQLTVGNLQVGDDAPLTLARLTEEFERIREAQRRFAAGKIVAVHPDDYERVAAALADFDHVEVLSNAWGTPGEAFVMDSPNCEILLNQPFNWARESDELL